MSVAAPEFNELWRWDGWSTVDETAGKGVVDLDGNVIIVGSRGLEAESISPYDDTFSDAESGDFAAVKLSSSGEVVWTWTASSLDGEADVFIAVDIDSNNDVVMGGYTHGYWEESNPLNVRHVAVVKLSASGEEVWRYQESPLTTSSTTLSGTYHSEATVIGVAIDDDDNVLLAGQTIGSMVFGEGSNQDSDFFVKKHDGTDGSEIWTIQIGETTSFDAFQSVKADSAGDVVAVGISGEVDTNFVVLKLSGVDGTVLWEHSPVTSFTQDVPKAVDIDAQGDVYVCGGFDAQNLQGLIAETPVVLKFSGATGDVVWTYEGAATSRAAFNGVSVDPVTGWVVGAGVTEGTWVTGAASGDDDFAAVLLDGDGNELSRYQDEANGNGYLSFVGFDSAGSLFVGGSWTDVDQSEFVVIKFAPFDVAEPTLAPSLQPTASALPASPAPMDATLAPLTSEPLSPASPAPVLDDPSPTPTPSSSPVGRGGLPTPAPTSTAAAATLLVEWEIGAIAGGGTLFLLLLGLCEYPSRNRLYGEEPCSSFFCLLSSLTMAYKTAVDG